MQKLAEFAKIIGIDKSIAYSSGSRLVGGIAGVISVFFISTFLSGVEQGFYYTFGSILAMQVFFELGLTGIMTQYVAYEVSHLTLNKDSHFMGEEKYKSRLASLIRFCVKWYSILAIAILFFLLIVGFIYFGRYGNNKFAVSWKIPWLLICIGTSIKLFQSPFISIYTGLGKVKEMSEISFWQQIILAATTWLGLVCGLKLYVVGLSYIMSVIFWQLCISHKKLDVIIVNLWRTQISEQVNYVKEIFPYQWRIALSGISSYFLVQMFNPVLFAIEGPVIAGQMGMTMQGLNAIQAFSLSWLNTKIPLYSQLIALRDYAQLDRLFNNTVKQMISVCLVLLIVFFLFIWFLNISHIKLANSLLSERFLNYVPLIFMMISVFLQQYVFAWTTYIRCHKKEPFVIISICMSVVCSMSTLLLGKLYGLYGMTIGYCLISIFFFPWWYHVYRIKKFEWHKPPVLYNNV